MHETPACPLCGSDGTRPLATAHRRDYLVCPDCRLAFMEPAQRPDAGAERGRYETHENDPGDEGYRRFLARLADPLIARLPPGAEGLDYGSGPGPTLSVMLEEAGFPMATYDPFFAPDAGPLRRTYDFITCSETAEHFFAPADELGRLETLLRPGGWLGLMTRLRDERQPFGEWWYTRDPTHVCFYHPETLEWIAAAFGWSLERPHPDVALFRST